VTTTKFVVSTSMTRTLWHSPIFQSGGGGEMANGDNLLGFAGRGRAGKNGIGVVPDWCLMHAVATPASAKPESCPLAISPPAADWRSGECQRVRVIEVEDDEFVVGSPPHASAPFLVKGVATFLSIGKERESRRPGL